MFLAAKYFLFVSFTSLWVAGFSLSPKSGLSGAFLGEDAVSIQSKCIAAAASKLFLQENTFPGTILYLVPAVPGNRKQHSVTRHLLPKLAETGNWSVMVRNSTQARINFPKINLEKARNYLVQIRDFRDFQETMGVVGQSADFNPHARFLVYCSDFFPNPKKIASDVLQTLVELLVVEVVVVLRDDQNTQTFKIYTWFLFSYGSCGSFERRHPVEILDSCISGILQKNEILGRNRVPDKFNKCPVVVRMVDIPPYVLGMKNGTWRDRYREGINEGIEVNLINMIMEEMNVVALYLYSGNRFAGWGDVSANNSVYGNLVYLQNRIGHFCIGGYVQSAQRMMNFDMTIPYTQDSFIWCVPHRPVSTKLAEMTKVFGLLAFLFTLFLYISTSLIIWYFARRNPQENKYFHSLSNTLQNNFTVLIGMAVFTSPRTSLLRLAMAGFCLFCLYENIAHQTYLTSILTKLNYREEILDMEDIVNSDLELFAAPTVMKYFSEEFATTPKTKVMYEAIRRRLQVCNNTRLCFRDVAVRQKSALVVTSSFRNFILHSYTTKSNVPLVHCFDEKIAHLGIGIMMVKGLPIVERFNKALTRILEAGMILKWLKDEEILPHEQAFTEGEVDTAALLLGTEIDKELSFWEFAPFLGIFLAGCGISGAVFVAEVFWYKLQGWIEFLWFRR